MLARWLWDDWTRPSDLGLRMTKLGLLLLIATLIGNRILPKTIDLPVGDWLAIWLITKQPTSACGAPLWMKMVAARAGLSEPRDGRSC